MTAEVSAQGFPVSATDTLWADVSEFQGDANDQYPYRGIAFRSNDGTYQDHHFAANIAWAKSAIARGRLNFFLVYYVWETNWQETIQTFQAMVGAPHPKMAVMIDVESWGGKVGGNQAAGINAAREANIKYLHGNRKGVVGYGNAGDLASLWPTRGDAQIVLANYSANPAFPNKLAHQFGDNYPVPPFGRCDINSADGLSVAQVVARLGLTTPPAPTPTPTPTPPKMETDKMLIILKFPAATGAKNTDAVYVIDGIHVRWVPTPAGLSALQTAMKNRGYGDYAIHTAGQRRAELGVMEGPDPENIPTKTVEHTDETGAKLTMAVQA